jgi:hypothetical protein
MVNTEQLEIDEDQETIRRSGQEPGSHMDLEPESFIANSKL